MSPRPGPPATVEDDQTTRSVQFGQRLAPRVLVARLAGAVHLGVPDDALLVDDEGAAVGEAALLVENAVFAGQAPMRPEVGEQRELVALLLGPDLVAGGGVDADGEHLHRVVDEVAEVVPDGA